MGMFKFINRARFLFLFLMVVLFCFFKAIDAQVEWFEFKDLVFLILILVSLLVIGHKEKWLVGALILVALVELSIFIIQLYVGDAVVEIIKMLISSVFFVLMFVGCIYFTMQDETISITTLFGSLSAYLFLGLFFAYLYVLMELMNPLSFNSLNTADHASVIYFSFVTLTTLGFGDIYPITPIAQTFVWFEAYAGQCYLAVIMGQLVGRYVAEKMRR